MKQSVMDLLHRADEPPLLTDIVAQQFVHEPNLRQRILETDSAGERIKLLCEHLRKISTPD